MEKSSTVSIKLGIFVLIAITLFTVAVYLIGQKQHLFSDTFEIRAHFNNVNGLQPGNNVRLSGINVGSVLEVSFLNDSIIEVKMLIKESVRKHIKRNAIASIGTDGLMGNMLVNISPGKGETASIEKNALVSSYSRIKTEDILNTLNVTNDNAALLTNDLLEMTQQLKTGRGVVSTLMYDTLLPVELRATTRNLYILSVKSNELMQELMEITQSAKQGSGTIGWLLTDTLTGGQVFQILETLQQTSQRLQSATDSIVVVLADIKDQKGVLPTMLQDSLLANDLRESLRNVKEGTASFNQNMEALKKSKLLRKYFKDLEEKALKR